MANAGAMQTGAGRSEAGARARPKAGDPAVRAPRASERRALVAWLDDGLRAGRRGRLEAEYPLSMQRGRLLWHRAVFDAGRPLAHAMLHRVEVEAKGRRLALGLIGNVYTDPAARGRGLARACIESCTEEARTMGLSVVALWSELEAFYTRLDFHECGRERYLALDAAMIARASEIVRASPVCEARSERGLVVHGLAKRDLPELERLYAAKAVHVDRKAGALERLAAAPDTQLVVARRGGRAAAYAALGRGDDFEGVVHEWAGEPDGVLACLAELCRPRRRLLALRGPLASRAFDALARAGAEHRDAGFARVRLLDAARLWAAIGDRNLDVEHVGDRVTLSRRANGSAVAERGRIQLSEREALTFFFGRGSGADGSFVGDSGDVADRLRAAFPTHREWPLYVWGFDSI